MRLVLVIVLTLAAATVQDRFLDGVMRPADVTVRPQVVVKRLPPYLVPGLTGPAGQLRVEFVVDQDGLVRQARVTQPVGPKAEFEAETIAAVKAWKFQPAQKDGAPVRMVAAMTVTFKPSGTLLSGDAVVEGVDDDFAKGIPMFAPGMIPARARKQFQPPYPSGVRDRLPSTWVRIEAVVASDGALGDLRIIQSTDYRFDLTAAEAVRLWTFDPATKDGVPTPSRVVVEMEFRSGQYRPPGGAAREANARPLVKTKRVPEFVGSKIGAPEGQLRVEFTIDTNGSVKQAKLTQPIGRKNFDRDAVEAAKAWKFEPALKDGRPVPAQAAMVVDFKQLPARQNGVLMRELTATVTVEGADDEFGKGALTAQAGVIPPERTRSVAPTFTMIGRPPSGVVHIEAVIRPDGSVGQCRQVGGNDLRLYGIMLNAVRQWTFNPALQNGQPVAFLAVFVVRFDVQ